MCRQLAAMPGDSVDIILVHSVAQPVALAMRQSQCILLYHSITELSTVNPKSSPSRQSYILSPPCESE